MIQRFLIPFRLAVCLLAPALAESGRGAGLASGFGAAATPAEEALAAQPEPDGYFREMTGFWHGVPGLEALRARWEGFAGKDAGFAVLAALISESEGKPEEALEKLQGLPGNHARWNEGRLLALLGREGEAVAILSALVTAAERPEMGAAALIALTELDCIRGNFAEALRRTTGAWEERNEEGFRLRILERHLSLLVEAGREKGFLEEQFKAAKSTGDKTAARTAQRVLAVMADWFTEDSRLTAQRDALAQTYRTQPDNCGPFGSAGRRSIDCGVLMPQPPELIRLAGECRLPPERALALAHHYSAARLWPEEAEGASWLKEVMSARPFGLQRILSSYQNPLNPLPPLARRVAMLADPGVAGTTLDLINRAWEGKAGPQDAETLAGIVAGAPEMRARPSAFPGSRGQSRFAGWPAVDEFPSDELVWNLQGQSWAEFYATSCRRELLRENHSEVSIPGGGGLRVWSEWRPDWPIEGVEPLMGWAWRQLKVMGEATPERATAIAGRMMDPGDRVLFAALCGRTELLTRWCQEATFLKQVRTVSLMRAARIFQKIRQETALTPDEARASLHVAVEVAERMGMTLLDLIRTQPKFQPANSQELSEAIGKVAASLFTAESGAAGGMVLIYEDEARLKMNKAALPRTVPHPLFGLPVCPSVERYRMLAGMLKTHAEPDAWSIRDPVSMALNLLLGGDSAFGYQGRPAALLAELALFPTSHPIKHQLRRWTALLEKEGVTEVHRQRIYESQDTPSKMLLRKLLAQMADEEQAYPAWHLARVALEGDAARKAVKLDILRARSLLTAGVFLPVRRSQLPPPPPAQAVLKVPAAAVAGHFLTLIRDPAGRRVLEPVGVLTDFANGSLPSVFHLALRTMSGPEFEETASLLMEAADPLAARMAVILANRYGADAVERWMKKALSAFPDDPELLLASINLQERSEADKVAVFVRALDHLTVLQQTTAFSESQAWCGSYAQYVAPGAAAVQAIARFADRNQPAMLPRDWMLAMEYVLKSPTEVVALTDIKSVALALIRCREPYIGSGNIPDWRPALNNLSRAGKEKEAAAVAEALLSQPLGSIAWPTDAAEVAPAWMGSSSLLPIGTGSEGWLCLQLAGKTDPAALADRMQAVAARHPGDEHTAFAALLARGLVRPLTPEDLNPLAGLSTTGRHRAVAFASWLLPPDRLPATIVLEAWETQAVQEFDIVWNGARNFLHGNDYLDRLEAAGAMEAARRCLPALLKAAGKTGDLPDGYPGKIVDRLSRLGTPAQAEELRGILAARVLKLPENPYSYAELAKLTWHFIGEDKSNLPEELVRRVTKELDAAAAGPLSGVMMENHRLLRLANAAAGDVRWHPALRKLLSAIPPEEKLNIPGWQRLAMLMETLDSGRLVPSLNLILHQKENRSMMLKWSFQGLLPSKPPAKKQPYQTREIEMLPWPSLAADLAGKFDALFMVDDVAGAGERIVARQDNLISSGELTLAGLPVAGRLRVQLVLRESPHAITISLPLGFNLSPLMMDTGRLPASPLRHPKGWSLLCEPAALNHTTRWQLEHSARPASPDIPDPLSGVALLTLDADGKVCGGAFVSQFQGFREPEFEGFPGFLLYLGQLTSGFDAPNPDPNAPASVGVPRFLALAVQDPSEGGNDNPAGLPPSARLSRITVRNWPVEEKAPR